MIGGIVDRRPPAWQQCEVCLAARRLQTAVDALNTFVNMGGKPHREDTRSEAVKEATALWEYARGGRHTGAPHAPVVVG